jgi:hypothetical protein
MEPAGADQPRDRFVGEPEGSKLVPVDDTVLPGCEARQRVVPLRCGC